MKKILFPTDFSKASLNAFVYAIHLAKRIGAEIITLHVYDLPTEFADLYHANILANYEVTEWDSFENYKGEVPKLRGIAEKHHAKHVKLSHVLERGDVVDTILKVAARDEVDCIVLGTNGAGAIDELLFGTVAESVMNRSKMMVFAIPAKCQYTPISKILFLTQYENHHKKTLHQLAKFAAMFAAHIDVLQVKDNYDEADIKIKKEWEAEFKKDGIDFMILQSDSVEEMIVDVIELHHINLAAMTVRHKGLFARLFRYSVASTMAFHSKVPVLAIKY